MPEENKKQEKTQNIASENGEVSINEALGIKRVRTFADDLREAKESAGIEDAPEPPKKKGFFGSFGKKETKSAQEDDESNPEQIKDDTENEASFEEEQPSKNYIEAELARSGIIAQERGGDAEEDDFEQDTHGDEEVMAPQESTQKVQTIRTYKYDAAERAQDKNLSAVSIAAAEQNRRARNKDFSLPNNETPIGKNIVYILVSIVLVASVLWGLFYFYNQTKIDNDPVATVNRASLLFTNSEQRIDIDGVDTQSILGFLAETRNDISGNENEITEITLLQNTILGKREMSGGEFLTRISRAPRSFIRSIEDNFLIGILGGSEKEMVLIFKTTDFDVAFAGMLDWEATMHTDLETLTESSTRGNFEDVILRNKDTRLLRDQDGETVLLYTFPNTETILITTSEEAFFEVFERLSASNASSNR